MLDKKIIIKVISEFSLVDTILKEVLNSQSVDKDENDNYSVILYADYRDSLSKTTIEEMFLKENPKDYFYEKIYDIFSETKDYIFEDIKKAITKAFEENEIGLEDDSLIYEWLNENIGVEYPYNHFLNQEVKANLILDTGDGEYDFTLNGGYNDNFDEIHDESSLLWLSKSQGYTKEQLQKAVQNNEYINSKFLESVALEIENTGSMMNTVTLLFKATLNDLLDFSSEDSNISGIKICKETNCGLVDYWNGCGGPLEIELEKEVIVNKDIVDSFSIDGFRGTYSIETIYGPTDSVWNGSVEFIRNV